MKPTVLPKSGNILQNRAGLGEQNLKLCVKSSHHPLKLGDDCWGAAVIIAGSVLTIEPSSSILATSNWLLFTTLAATCCEGFRFVLGCLAIVLNGAYPVFMRISSNTFQSRRRIRNMH
jgi:hypothetical protein